MAPLSPVLPHEMAPPRPATITAAMWIWIVGAVIAVAVIPVMMLGNLEEFRATGESTASDQDAAELGGQVIAVMFGLRHARRGRAVHRVRGRAAQRPQLGAHPAHDPRRSSGSWR